MSNTIDIGIDLGTTNSAIAILSGTSAEIIRNVNNQECTPSAVWARDPRHAMVVGQLARSRLRFDPENTASKFKLLMGTDVPRFFKAAGRKMLPEELSAEVLRSLKVDAEQYRMGEPVDAVVITVPASFKQPQLNATQKAAALAGFSICILEQEPIAAGLAYSFQSQEKRSTWFVYDLGGGTFDAAVLRAEGGRMKVLDHAGDEHLGGEIFDRSIVDQLLVPALLREFRLPGFSREDARWNGAYAELHWKAEEAKIQLSRVKAAHIDIEFREPHGNQDIHFEYELTRTAIEHIVEPLVAVTIQTCRNVLARAAVSRWDVEKVLLVGGPTHMPYIRARLLDEKEGLGIPLCATIDPMTVVARGAAIYAGSHQYQHTTRSVKAGTLGLTLNYEPIGASERAVIKGRLTLPVDEPLIGWTVEFARDGRVPWSSQKLVIDSNGQFEARLFGVSGIRNTFKITVRDSTRAVRATNPSECVYTVGMTSSEQRVNHAFGIAMADNRVDQLIPRGAILPVEVEVEHELAWDIVAGGDIDIRIPLVEGEYMDRADRNRVIGDIRLDASQLRASLPRGTVVRIHVVLDTSGILSAQAYIPTIGAQLQCENATRIATLTKPELSAATADEKRRLEQLRVRVDNEDHEGADELLDAIVDQGVVGEMDRALDASRGEPAAALECENRLMMLRRALDQVQATLDWPPAVTKAAEVRSYTQDRVWSDEGTIDEENELAELEKGMDDALISKDLTKLLDITKRMDNLDTQVYWRMFSSWIHWFNILVSRQNEMSNHVAFQRFQQIGETAIDTDHFPRIQQACFGLSALLPPRPNDPAPPSGLSGVTRRKAI
jgi:molecular chaperone DnaK